MNKLLEAGRGRR